MGAAPDGGHVVLDAEDVGDLRHRDDLGAGADLCGDLLGRDAIVVVHAQVDEVGAHLATELLPRDDVRVVLHDGDDHVVAGADHGPPERLRHEVERLARVAREDDLVALRLARVVHGADERGDVRPGIVDGGRRLDGEAIEAAQRVRVHGLVEASLGVKHRGGALRGGGAVEEGEAGVGGQKREVGLEGALGDGRELGIGEHAHASSSRTGETPSSKSCATSAPRTASARRTAASCDRCSGEWMMASSKSARTKSCSASRRESPRSSR